MATLEFTYDGTVKAITATKNCTVEFALQGGGGGGGGNDSPYSGVGGLSGSAVNGSISLSAGETIYCAVGSRGFGGSTTPGSGGSAPGSGGYGLDGFSGGEGGRAGWSGWSGGGGGGGAATVLYKVVNGQRQYIAIAAGGGGGGGGGNHSPGYINSYSPYAATPGPQTYVSSTVTVAGSWWYSGIHVRTGGYMGGANPAGGYDSSGWPIREIRVYENGSLVYVDYGSAWPSGYTNAGKVDEAYISGDDWAGGGDYWAVYSFSRVQQVLSNVSAFITRGGKGKNHGGDGGGPGGGGGGYPGGRGGVPPGGDYGAMSGSTGYSVNYASGGSGISRSSTYASNGSGGGGGGGQGYDGYAAFRSTQCDINVLVSQTWQKPSSIYYMQNSSWIPVNEVYYRQNNEWVRVYGDNIPAYAAQSAAFNNASGPAVA